MPDAVKKIASLIVKYWRQELKEEELNELLDWANHSPANRETFARLTNPDFLVDHLRELTQVKQEMRDRIWTQMQFSGEEWQEPGQLTEEDKRKFKWPASFAWTGGAAAIVLVAGGLYFFHRPASNSLLKNAGNQLAEPVLQAGEPSTGALVRFDDGQLLDVSAMFNGTATEQGPVKLEKEAGGIRFSTAATIRQADSASFITVSTPGNEGLTVWLPDGTEVMMNMASRLRFPAVFDRHHRTVEASGELYFRVAARHMHGAPVPFLVCTSGMNLEAPAGSFNVQVYPKDTLARASLESGTLRVWKQVQHTGKWSQRSDKVDVLLKPGQQAQISNDAGGVDMGGIRVENVSLEEVMSWKNKKPAK